MQSQFDTPLGQMIAIANNEALYLLEFIDAKGLKQEINRLQHDTQSAIGCGTNAPIISIKHELTAWFNGELNAFETPIILIGSCFQKEVWNALCTIPYGETRSYLEQATLIGRPTACRAVANANGANQLAIIIPCHRIINTSGALGGYAGGLSRKKWLLEHEKKWRKH